MDIHLFLHLFNFYIFTMQRTTSEIQIDCLRRQLGETNLIECVKCSNCLTSDGNTSTNNLDKNVSLRESEAIIVIKQLQDKVCFFAFFLNFLFVNNVLFLNL